MESSTLRRTVIAGALVAAILTGCDSPPTAPTPPVAPPPLVVAAPPPEPAWMREPRDDADRALLARLLNSARDVRKAAVEEWDAARMASERLADAEPQVEWPRRSADERGAWETDDDSTPVSPGHAVYIAFENRTRALTRGLVAALRAGDVPTRAAAAWSMGAMWLHTGKQLTEALADAIPEVRVAAAEALSAHTNTESRYDACLPAMCKLLDDPDWRVRAAAARALPEYARWCQGQDREEVRAVPRLLELAADEHAEVRANALEAIRVIDPPERDAELRPVFAKALADPSPDVRAHAARWCGRQFEYGPAAPFSADVVAALRALLKDWSPDVRWGAAYAVWRTTHESAGVVPVLAEQVAASRGSDLNPALRLLAEIGPDAEAAVPAIVSKLTEDTYAHHGTTGTEAMDALCSIGPATATTLPLLDPMLADAEPARRSRAAYAVAMLDGDDSARDAVLARRLARETDVGVRHAIHAARGAIGAGGASLLADLVAGLRASDEDERAGALRGWQALGREAAPASSDALEALLAGSGAEWSRDQARVALAPVGRASHGLNALSWPGEPQGWVSERFVALGPLGPEDAPSASALVAALDVDWPYPAGRALASIGAAAKDVLPELRRRLGGPPSAQRVASAEALLAIGGDADALAVLVDAVEKSAAGPKEETDEGLGPAAAWALSRAGDAARPAIPALRMAADREGSPLQTAAVCALARLGDGDRIDAIVERIGQHSPAPPSELIETLGAIGPAAARATSVLERIATTWQRYTGEDVLDASRAAIRSLGQIGPSAASALPSLRKLRRNALLRATAEEAIRRIEE